MSGTLKGDGQAYARQVKRYQERVASRMWRFTRDTVHHQELVQDVFVEAFLSLKTYKGRAPLEHGSDASPRMSAIVTGSTGKGQSTQMLPLRHGTNCLLKTRSQSNQKRPRILWMPSWKGFLRETGWC